MDIRCPKCGEPWDFDTLHEEAQERYGIRYGEAGYDSVSYQRVYAAVRDEFQAKGCAALSFASPCSETTDRGRTAAAIYDLLGDDMDGAAAMLEDAELLGL
jgi:hypothetical protein